MVIILLCWKVLSYGFLYVNIPSHLERLTTMVLYHLKMSNRGLLNFFFLFWFFPFFFNTGVYLK